MQVVGVVSPTPGSEPIVEGSV